MGDPCVIIMPALGGILFASLNRHPLAGIACGFVGACGGLSANVILTAIDPLLSGFTHAAAQMLDKNYNVYPTANYYFMFASSFLITIVGTFVTNWFVEPRLGSWTKPSNEIKSQESYGSYKIESTLKTAKNEEKKALRYTSAVFLILLFGLVLMIVPTNGVLRDSSGSLQPFYKSIVLLIMVIFLVSGFIYGYLSGSVKSGKDLISMINESVATVSSYIVLAFAASQFLAYFNWSNLGIYTAVHGAGFFKSLGLTGIPLLIGFLLFTMFINLFITSASAKWAVFAPVFVPMMMLLGFSPETTQAVFRVGDSVTNIITPLLPYFPLILVTARRYEPGLSLGKLISTLLPYSITLFLVWGLFLVFWIIAGLPLGPDVKLFYN